MDLSRSAALTDIRAAANPDSTSTLQNPSSDLLEAFGVTPTVSGVHVTENMAFKISAFNACVKVLSEDTAGLPWPLYREQDDVRSKATDHRLYSILHDEANEEMSSFTFRETEVVNLCCDGNAYGWIEEANDGFPLGFWPLAPSRTEIWRGPDRKLYYLYRFLDGTTTVFPARRVLHFRLMSKDGIVGMSPLAQAREALGLGQVAQDFGSRYFSQGLHAGGWFQVKGTMSDDAYLRLKKTLNESGGMDKAHKWRIAEEGAEVKEATVNAQDAQFLETRVHQMRDIARFFRMQPHKIGDLERSTNNNIEHQGIEHVVDTIQPMAIRFETEVNRKALTPSERAKGYFSEMLLDGMMRGDMKTRAEVQARRIGVALLKPNEGRRQENLPPEPGGDKLYIQSGYIPLEMAAEGKGAESGRRRDDKLAQAATELLEEFDGELDTAEMRAVVNRYCRRHPDADLAARIRTTVRPLIDGASPRDDVVDLLNAWKQGDRT